MELGKIIKNARKAKGFSQKDLAEGISTQSTISNLEKNNVIVEAQTLKAISNRLNIDFKELVDCIPNKNCKTELFQESKKMLQKRKYNELKNLVTNTIDTNKLSSNEVKEYRYLLGIANLYGVGDYEEALYQLNLGLQEGHSQRISMIETLTMNGIGLAYCMANELEKATFYIQKALNDFDEMTIKSSQLDDLNEGVIIYSTTATYYSYVKEYKKADRLYKKAIDLQKKAIELFEIDNIYYERGLNLAKMGALIESKKMFFIGLGIAELNTNKPLIDKILKVAKEYGLDSIEYEK